MNGNEAHSLDERLRFGSAGPLTSVSRVMPPVNHQMRLFNKWKIAALLLFQILYAVKYFISHSILKLSTRHHLPAHYLKLLVDFLVIYLSLLGKNLGGGLGIFLLRGHIGLWVFHIMLGISYEDQLQ